LILLGRGCDIFNIFNHPLTNNCYFFFFFVKFWNEIKTSDVAYLTLHVHRWLGLEQVCHCPPDGKSFYSCWCISWLRTIPITGSIDFFMVNGDTRKFTRFTMNIQLPLGLLPHMRTGLKFWSLEFHLFLVQQWFLGTWSHFGCGLLYGRLRQLRRTAGTHAMLFLFAESPFYFT